jgi:hypothetical protein
LLLPHGPECSPCYRAWVLRGPNPIASSLHISYLNCRHRQAGCCCCLHVTAWPHTAPLNGSPVALGARTPA